MLDRASTRRLGRALAACCGLAMLALAPQPASAQDDDAPFEHRFIRGLLGGNKPAIDYRERSPLVIPPSTELPTPERGTAATGVQNWPNDPDAARRRQASADGNAPVTDLFREAGTPLSPNELRRGTRRGARSNEPVRTPSDGEMLRPLTPAQLGETKSLFGLFGSSNDKPVAFAVEPERSRMIDPPAGYLTPAPTQPYAPPKDSGSWFKPFNWFDRGTGLER
jgi:hypothetical protein